MSETINKLFTEIFRPKKLEQMILPERIRSEVKNGLTKNFMFIGNPGNGKSTITKILADGHDVLFINASEDRGIDIIKDKIINFCGTLSLEQGKEKFKVVILEECDGLTIDAWKALRAVIEKYADSVRFISNCNYIEKIPDPIKSRFTCIPMHPINQKEEEELFLGYYNWIGKILSHQSITISYTEETLKEFIKIDFPDMRTILNKVQSLYNRGIKEISKESLASSFDFSDLFNIIINEPNAWDNYKLIVSEYSNKVDDAIIMIGKKFPEYLRTTKPGKIDKLPLVLISIAEHQQQANFVPDKMITLLSMIYKIQLILK